MRKKRLSPAGRREAAFAYLFLLPLLLGVVIFFLIPIVQAFYYSLTNWKGVGQYDFILFDNYVKMFTVDPDFWLELKNTLIFVFASVPVTIAIALVIAVLLNANIRGVGLYRVIYFLPNVVMGTVVAMVWKWLLNSQYGPVDALLDFLFGIRPAWLSDTNLTMFSMCVIAVWSGLGYCVVILLASLQGIGKSYYEAAKIDGATPFAMFRYITFPMVSPSIFFLLIMRAIAAFNQFDLVYMLGGNPGPVQDSLRTIVFGIYQSGFSEFSMGYACAKAVILFVLIMIVTVCQLAGEKHWVNY